MTEFIWNKGRKFEINLENITLFTTVFVPLSESDGEIYSHLSDEVLPPTIHSHVTTELFICQKGEIFIDTSASLIVLQEGDAALVPAGIMHLRVPDGTDSIYRAIHFSCKKHNVPNAADLYQKLASLFHSETILIFRNRPDIMDISLRIIELSAKAGSLIPSLRSVELLLRMAQSLQDNKGAVPQSKTAEQNMDSEHVRLSFLDQYIHNSFMESHSLKDISGQMHLSTRQLDRIVRKNFGMTFHQVIMEQRILTAEKLLLTTNFTAEKIGFSVGFSSLSGFYREFIRKHGITPAKYRSTFLGRR